MISFQLDTNLSEHRAFRMRFQSKNESYNMPVTMHDLELKLTKLESQKLLI